MAIPLSARRRWLIGTTSALLFATPALAQTRQPANQTRTKAAEGGITATERLMRDSGVLLRILAIYDAGGRRLGGGEDIEPKIFTQAAETMRDFVHDYHEKQAEAHVFARFKKDGRMVELIDVLQAQHAAGRKLTDHILELAPKSTTKNERQAMIEAMHASMVLYRPHVARELTDVWPTLRTLLTPNEFDDLGVALEKEEVEKLGKDGFDKTAKQVEALEKRIGINDLSQFTPKS
jgi:hemerythrin-like domain-containing protein